MNLSKSCLVMAALAFAGGTLAAQQKGSEPPAIEFVKVWNDGPSSFDELEGKVVILDFGATWWGPCKGAVPHLNELHEKFADQGLLVIGVSDEEESKIEKTFIDDLGAKYPMAKIKKSDTQKYGIKFYPSIYCIAPDGTVHSVPDDRMPSEAVIKELLQSVSLAPKLPDESRYAPVRSMWEGKQYKKLDVYLTKILGADKLDDEMRTVFEAQREELDKRAAKQVARVGKVGQGPDYFAAKVTLQKIQKEWLGFEAAGAAKIELARFAKDRTIKKEIAASKSLNKLLRKFDPSKISQRRKLKASLQKFAAKNAGTYAGEDAAKQFARFR